MNINISPELESFVAAKLASGVYNSANELFSEAVSLLAERDALQQRRIAAMDEFIQTALDEAEEDDYLTPEEVEKDINDFIEKLAKNA